MASIIESTWRMFQIRRALLTSKFLAFSFYHINATVRFPEIQTATASLLYINLLSILDAAMATQMTAEEYERCGNVRNRVMFLRARGKILDEPGLIAIKDRRNEMGHEAGKDATVDELAAAVEKVEEQLLAWGSFSGVHRMRCVMSVPVCGRARIQTSCSRSTASFASCAASSWCLRRNRRRCMGELENDLEWPNNTYRITPFDPAFEKKMKKTEEIMNRCRNTLHVLAR